MGKNSGKLTDLEKLDIEFFNNHRSYLRGENHKQESKFSQNLIFLASGVFTLSIAFSKYIDIVEYKELLIVSWICSLLSLFTILFSFYFSANAFQEEIKCWDEKEKDCEKNCSNLIRKWCVGFSIFCFVLSLVLFLIFYSLNFLYVN